jgi:hypothetical protein
MLYTSNRLSTKGRWNDIRNEIRKIWGKLSVNELDDTRGENSAIGSLIHQKYGENEDTYGTQLSKILKQFEAKKRNEVRLAREVFRLHH